MTQRVTFYIDGFNFYYGLRRTKHNDYVFLQNRLSSCHIPLWQRACNLSEVVKG